MTADELRKFADEMESGYPTFDTAEVLRKAADEIDKLMSYLYVAEERLKLVEAK